MILLCTFIFWTYLQTVHGYEPRIITPWNVGNFTNQQEDNTKTVATDQHYKDICPKYQPICDIIPQGQPILFGELQYS